MFTRDGQAHQIQVDAIDLREYVEQNFAGRSIRLIKMDVEGVEPVLLRALADRLQSNPPDGLLIEVNGDQLARHGFTAEDVLGPLTAAGFHLTSPGCFGRLRRVPPKRARRAETRTGPPRGALIEGLRTRRNFFNVFATPRR